MSQQMTYGAHYGPGPRPLCFSRLACYGGDPFSAYWRKWKCNNMTDTVSSCRDSLYELTSTGLLFYRKMGCYIVKMTAV